MAAVSRGTPTADSGRWRPSLTDHCQNQQLHALSSISSSHQTHQQHQHQQSHSCYTLASVALETLQLEARYGCAKHALEDPDSVTLPLLNIDHILEANKSALSMLYQTVDCKCTERLAPLTFLHASIISKVVFWY